jgi:hypothetical protein
MLIKLSIWILGPKCSGIHIISKGSWLCYIILRMKMFQALCLVSYSEKITLFQKLGLFLYSAEGYRNRYLTVIETGFCCQTQLRGHTRALFSPNDMNKCSLQNMFSVDCKVMECRGTSQSRDQYLWCKRKKERKEKKCTDIKIITWLYMWLTVMLQKKVLSEIRKSRPAYSNRRLSKWS